MQKQSITYGVLTEGERHLLSITTDLNIDLTINTEGLMDSSSQVGICLGLKETVW